MTFSTGPARPRATLIARFLARFSAALPAIFLLSALPVVAADEERVETLATGLKSPESVAVGTDGRIYVSVIGKPEQNGDGEIAVVEKGKATTFARGLDDPKGLAAWKDWLFVADKQRVWRIDREGKAEVFAAADAFPRRPRFLNDLAVDDKGNLYVSDTGDFQGREGAVFRIGQDGKVKLVVDAAKSPAIKGPNGLALEDAGHLLLLDFMSGDVLRINLADGTMLPYAGGFPGGDGLAFDQRGKLYVSEWTTGKVWVLGKESHSPTVLPGKFQSAADICIAPDGRVLVPDMLAGTVSAIRVAGLPAVEVDETPLAVEPERAFPNIEVQLPVLLTHAGDGSNRVFVASQLGKVYVFPNDQDVGEAEVFLDLEDKVRYYDKEFEEGFLGMAFHPRYKQNGELFVFYTTKDAPHTSVISRFRTSKQNPNHADAKTEEELLRIPRPFWNHDGGTLAFGPDGYLYIAVGDGGKGNDPFGNGQNLRTLLGKILRIDVDHHEAGSKYAIPKDNPFLDYPHARPEIWAHGLRNVWRFAFDRQTGALWAADVGQDLWEEVDLIERGGNYGWNLREGKHPLGIGGVQAPREDLTEPVLEYHHGVGKSITGGCVYRGQRVPQLAGWYLYADYVTGQLYALNYDVHKKQLLANRPIRGNISPVRSFGEDENGEVYYMTAAGWLYRLRAQDSAAAGR